MTDPGAAMTPEPSRKERARNGRGSAATQFKPKNAGKPKGAKDRRRVLGQAAAAALEGRCWDVLERLLSSPSWRARHEAAKTTLAYALGLPRATLEVTGGFGNLADELAKALAEVRARRALEASSLIPSQGVSVDKALDTVALPEVNPALCLPSALEAPGAAIVSDDAEHALAVPVATGADDAAALPVVADPPRGTQ